ncbi:RidA family protein [Sphingosinicella soli]|uniref:Enamine deaminase RidA (YjgF/YER057c/UK114 family) n=1 Tax=Sphingosinicella soli TaxID=333708 RepID=A0A7W7F6P7_9SPHN|nr:RidA family protein [Sphingosinicella soli]MBB4632556.1 enamine deaminase RidA (YjgF/YER057c/UK114 family) [Sphingosinicella soli]
MLGLGAFSAHAQPLRHHGPDESPILAAVTIPPGSKLILLSGQVPPPLDPKAPYEAMTFGIDTRVQSIAVFREIESILSASGLGFGNIVKLTVFLAGDPRRGGTMDFEGFSKAYAEFFGTENQPHKVARSVVQVAALAHPEYLVEIEAIAVE